MIMLVDWASISFPLLSHSLSSLLRETIFSIRVTIDYKYSGSYLMVALTSGSGV